PVWRCDRLVSRAKVIENQVMAAPIISISSDSPEESVGSHAPRVILFDVIPAIIPIIPEVLIVLADPIVAPEVGTVLVVSPTGVLDLVDYTSSSDSDPSEDSLPPVPDLPLVSPSGSSSHDTLAPSSELPLAPIVAPPRIHSLSDSSSVHYSGCDSSGQAYSGPSTRVVSPRLVYPPVLTPRHSEEFRHWRSAPLSTPYLPTTSESSLGLSSERS
ncbi:hypothetical protein Tco_1580558, partial [Tanacetum coccineum]